MKKLKLNQLQGIGIHNDRKTTNHSNKDIDVSKSRLNYDIVDIHNKNSHKYARKSIYQDVTNYVKKNNTNARSIRNDAVYVNEWIISSDQAFFKRLSDKEKRVFFSSSAQFFANKFGLKNIRYAIVHLDESTPHMHLGVVPFDKNMKLSAKEVFNKAVLQAIQEELPSYLKTKGFNIERGEKGGKKHHLTTKEYKDFKTAEMRTKLANENLEGVEKQLLERKSELDFLSKNKKSVENELESLKNKAFNLKQNIDVLEKTFEQAYSQHRNLIMFEEDIRKNVQKIPFSDKFVIAESELNSIFEKIKALKGNINDLSSRNIEHSNKRHFVEQKNIKLENDLSYYKNLYFDTKEKLDGLKRLIDTLSPGEIKAIEKRADDKEKAELERKKTKQRNNELDLDR